MDPVPPMNPPTNPSVPQSVPTPPTTPAASPVSPLPVQPVSPPGPQKDKITPIFLTLFIVLVLALGGIYLWTQTSLNPANKPTPTPTITATPTITETVTPTTSETVTPTVTVSGSTTPTTTNTAIPTPTMTWLRLNGNFYYTEPGSTQPTSVPVSFEIPQTGYALVGSLLGTKCIQQVVTNGNVAQGIAGTLKLTYAQSCQGGSYPEIALPIGWVYVGRLTHKADDGSTINIVRIPGSKTNEYKYVQVLKSGTASVTASDKYTNMYVVHKDATTGTTHAITNPPILQLTPKSTSEKTSLLVIADRVVMSVRVE